MKMLVFRPTSRIETDHDTVLDSIVLGGEANIRAVIASMQSSKPVLVPCRDGGYAIITPADETYSNMTYHTLLTNAVTPKQLLQYSMIAGHDTIAEPLQWFMMTGVIRISGSGNFVCYVPAHNAIDARQKFEKTLQDATIHRALCKRFLDHHIAIDVVTHHSHQTGLAVRDDDDRPICIDDKPG